MSDLINTYWKEPDGDVYHVILFSHTDSDNDDWYHCEWTYDFDSREPESLIRIDTQITKVEFELRSII